MQLRKYHRKRGGDMRLINESLAAARQLSGWRPSDTSFTGMFESDRRPASSSRRPTPPMSPSRSSYGVGLRIAYEWL